MNSGKNLKTYIPVVYKFELCLTTMFVMYSLENPIQITHAITEDVPI